MTDDLLDDDTPVLPDGYKRMNWFRGFGNQMGPMYDKIGPGDAYTRGFYVCEHHTNGMGNCHGGMLMAFADVAFGHAVSMSARDRHWVTIRLVTDFVSGAKLGDWVEGNGEIAGIEDDIYTITGRIWCGDRTIMSGTGIFKTLGKRTPRK
jgi:acyl-coenzyme A thioesterase PaaI-like protein